MAAEARTMVYLRQHGYPVPAVDEVSRDGSDLIMERVDGPSMVRAISNAPWTVTRHAHMLADLHVQLHDIPPPDFLPAVPILTGHAVLHLDLHPLNVMIARTGPVVIDWSTAALGDPDIDVALAWVIMASGELPGGPMTSTLLGTVRGVLVHSFLARFERGEITPKLRAIVDAKTTIDPHMSAMEINKMWRVVDRAERRTSR